jgi:hypothetical protein
MKKLKLFNLKLMCTKHATPFRIDQVKRSLATPLVSENFFLLDRNSLLIKDC